QQVLDLGGGRRLRADRDDLPRQRGEGGAHRAARGRLRPRADRPRDRRGLVPADGDRGGTRRAAGDGGRPRPDRETEPGAPERGAGRDGHGAEGERGAVGHHLRAGGGAAEQRVMPGRWRRGPSVTEPVIEEGPFVSFTDLFIGILFLFLILVAALMLRQQAAVQTPPTPPTPVKPEPVPKRKPEQPAFRLGIVFNIYQRSAESDGIGWTYSRTVRVFRSPDGHCINTVWKRSNLSTAWMAPTAPEDIPTDAQREILGKFEPCGLSASGDHWESPSETG